MAEQPPAKKPRLERVLTKSPVRKLASGELVTFLRDGKMPQLALWVEANRCSGEAFVAELDNAPLEAKGELDTLSNLMRPAPAQEPVAIKLVKTFSVNTDIRPGSGHFFVERHKRAPLLVTGRLHPHSWAPIIWKDHPVSPADVPH